MSIRWNAIGPMSTLAQSQQECCAPAISKEVLTPAKGIVGVRWYSIQAAASW